MSRVLKFQLTFGNEWQVPGAVIAVAWQHDRLTVWCEVDADDADTRTLRVVATGGDVPRGVHVGSAVSDELVFHVYEVTL